MIPNHAGGTYKGNLLIEPYTKYQRPSLQNGGDRNIRREPLIKLQTVHRRDSVAHLLNGVYAI